MLVRNIRAVVCDFTKEICMKTRPRTFYGALFVVLALMVPLAAQARPFDHANGPGCGWRQSLPQEQRDAVNKLMSEHFKAVQPVRDQLWTKSRTLSALENNPTVDPGELRALVEEVAALRVQLRDQHTAFVDKVKKETGVDVPFRCDGRGDGFGRHYGGGYGHRGGNYHGGMNRW